MYQKNRERCLLLVSFHAQGKKEGVTGLKVVSQLQFRPSLFLPGVKGESLIAF